MLMRSLHCADVRNQRHKANAGNAERLADLTLAAQSAVELLQDDGKQRSADEEYDQGGKDEQEGIGELGRSGVAASDMTYASGDAVSC